MPGGYPPQGGPGYGPPAPPYPPPPGPPPPKGLSGGVIAAIVVGALLLLTGIGVTAVLVFGGDSAPASSRRGPSLSVQKLLLDYGRDESAADARYKGKTFDLTGGRVIEVKDGADGIVFVLIGFQKPYVAPRLRCDMRKDHRSRARGLARDTPIEVRGKVKLLFLDVWAESCEIL